MLRTASATALPSASTDLTQAKAAAMLRAAFSLFCLWQVSDGDARLLLGQPSASTYYRWKRGRSGQCQDTVWRLGDLMGIHKALRYMFTDPKRGYAWVRSQTPFGGNPRWIGCSRVRPATRGRAKLSRCGARRR